MKVSVSPSFLEGKITANASKSYTQRAYALAALSSAPSKIMQTSWCDDASAALKIAKDLGARVNVNDESVQFFPNERPVSSAWHAGEAGLSLRMFAPIAALFDQEIVFGGHGSLSTRPTDFIVNTLNEMGASVTGATLPLQIHGPLQSGVYHVDGRFSSQLLTGLLISLPLLKGDTQLVVNELKSIPYIDMTLDMIAAFGGVITHENYKVFHIAGGQAYKGADLRIEADWSGLAFILVAAAFSGNVTVSGVKRSSLQADQAIIDVLEMVGSKLRFDEDGVHVEATDLVGFTFDATHCPDLFPPLAVLATQCVGQTRISGVHRLKHKESDRGLTLSTELGKMGAQIEIEGDVMIINGKQNLHGAEVDACGDHRIAMALTCTALIAKGVTTIDEAECVSKSYHNFYSDMQLLNCKSEGDKELFVRRDASTYLK